MPPERRRPARCNSADDALLDVPEMASMRLSKRFTVAVEDVRPPNPAS
jgi:hypothetical protein